MLVSVHDPRPKGAVLAGRPATGKTPVRYIRIPDADWDDFRAVAGRDGPEALREFIQWYLRRPGAKLPARPSPEEIEALTGTASQR
jgi:hypothetical protein